MEDGRAYWVVEAYDDADHPNDRGYKRYDEDEFFLTEEACQAQVDSYNDPIIARWAAKVKEASAAHELHRVHWEGRKADWDFLVAAGRRTGEFESFGEFKSPEMPSYDQQNLKRVGKVTWSEKRVGDKITIEVW